ncbi:MAG TPA: type II toxin-antitoxin system VapC family toxin [Candidatus Nanopusillus sp.]|nr:type II toxin-antitoxin system VapC family toxin [Candidatus Nanopusillus sp.]
MKAVIDTNVIFAYLYDKDPYHKKAIEIIDSLEKIYLPAVVIFELIFLFKRYNIDLKVLYYLLSPEEVEYVETKLEDIYFALKNEPESYDEFNDYIILHTALRLKVKLETFDKELKEKITKI